MKKAKVLRREHDRGQEFAAPGEVPRSIVAGTLDV